MSRLDTRKQNELEPKRKDFAMNCLKHLGFTIHFESESEIRFMFKNEEIKFFPYSGWHTGKTIRDGRGINNLLNQLK